MTNIWANPSAKNRHTYSTDFCGEHTAYILIHYIMPNSLRLVWVCVISSAVGTEGLIKDRKLKVEIWDGLRSGERYKLN